METAATEGKERGTRGRKGKDKQEAVTKPEEISKGIGELVKLYTASQNAATEFNEAIKALAEKSGYNSSNVRAFVIARAGENFAEKKRNVEQQMELFDEVGE